LESEYIKSASKRFDLTARLLQCAGKQSLEIVKSQVKKSKKQMPRFKSLSATLDSRFWEITPDSNAFEWLKLQSGFKVYLPFKKTKMWNKWAEKGFALAKSIRISIKRGKLFIDFIFEKEAPAIKAEGSTEGLDLGYVNLAVCSDGQVIGEHLNEFVRTFKKREKHTHEQIKNKVLCELKKLDLSNINRLVVENLKYVKHGKRGMFSRTHNRRLSHWLYARVREWLAQHCEELGVRIDVKSPYKTSQYCHICHKWDKRNRNGEKFKCVNCGHKEHADFNASISLKLLGLAGVYSLRSLQTPLVDICP
jgi:IS605 OrfB family transposase